MLQACLESVGVDGVLLREWTQRDAGFLLPLSEHVSRMPLNRH